MRGRLGAENTIFARQEGFDQSSLLIFGRASLAKVKPPPQARLTAWLLGAVR